MKFKIYLLFVLLFFIGFKIDAQEISITTTSNSISWSPVKVTNSGTPLVWVATNSKIGTLTENANDPTFNFGANDGNPISIVVTGNIGYTGLSNLRIISSNIQDINLSGTIALTNLFLTGNSISNIDISNNSLLTRLLLANNNLTLLDITNNPIINDLRINNNNLNSNTLDNILNNLDSFGVSGGKLQIANNLGNLTSSAQPAFDNLVAKGWTIDVVAPPSPPVDQQSPTPVSDLSASNTTQTTTDLTWSASTDNVGVNDYEVFQDGNSIGLTGGLTNFTVTNLIASTNYAFNITAIDAAGNKSSLGNTVGVTTQANVIDTETPSAIIDLIASNTQAYRTDLSWSDSTDNVGVVDYEVFQDGVSVGFTGGLNSLTVNNLISCSNYSFTVFAIDQAGNTSVASNVINITTGTAFFGGGGSAPPPPFAQEINDLQATDVTTTTVSLAWTYTADPKDRILDFEIFQDGQSIGMSGGLFTFQVTGLLTGTNYNFNVEPILCSARSTSGADKILNITTLSDPDTELPSRITDLAFSNLTETTANLFWTASTDNVGIANYEVFQDGVSIGLTGGLTSFNVTGLTVSSTYAFVVFAIDMAGNKSLASNTANVTTLSDTEAPSNISDLTSSNITTSSVELFWSASTDNVGVTDYEVFKDGTSIGLTGGATTLIITGLVANSNYSFSVIALDASGNVSTVGNTINVTTIDIIDFTSINSNLVTVDWQARDLFADRNVGIGTMNTQGYRLAVAGSMVAEEIVVKLQTNWPDFVFEKDYKLPSLDEIEIYIRSTGHLMDVPSANEVKENGIKLGEMDAKLLQKIEELTLYAIEQKREIEKLEINFKNLSLMVENLEKSMKTSIKNTNQNK